VYKLKEEDVEEVEEEGDVLQCISGRKRMWRRAEEGYAFQCISGRKRMWRRRRRRGMPSSV